LVSSSVLLVLTGFAYSNCFSDVFIGFNALRSIRDNPDIQQLQSLWRAMSLHLLGPIALGDGGTLVRRPVLSLSFAVNHALTGSSPGGYQALNVVIHAMAGLALFGVVRRAHLLVRHQASSSLALSIAAFWLVHPLQTESVTYIPQRAESLMGLFLLLTLYCAVRAWQSSNATRFWKGAAVTACFLGVATKEVMVVAPVLVWLFDAVFLRGSYVRPLIEDRRFYICLFSTWLLLALFIVLTWADVRIDFHPPRILPYAFSQPRVVLHYLQLVFLPSPLHLYVNTTQFWFDPLRPDWTTVVAPAAVLTVLLAVTVLALYRRHWSGFAGIWFFLTLAPTSTFVATSDVIQEHRMYLALASPLALAIIGGSAFLRATLGRFSPRAELLGKAAVVAILLLASVALTRARNLDYRTEFGPYAPADLPNAYGVIAHYELALRRDTVAARRVFEQMLSLQLPEVWDNLDQPHFHRGRIINALGVLAALEGRYDDARRHFEDALATRPRWPIGESNLAVVELMAGSPQAARSRLEAAIPEDRGLYASRLALAVAMTAGGEGERAQEYIREYQIDQRRLQEVAATAESRRRNLRLRVTSPGMRPFDYVLALELVAADAN
jgi:tetratricopeptide (TPR) repeat protein